MFSKHLLAILFLGGFICSIGFASFLIPIGYSLLVFLCMALIITYACSGNPFHLVFVACIACMLGYLCIEIRIPTQVVEGEYSWVARVERKQSKRHYDRITLRDSRGILFTLSVPAPSEYLPGDRISGACEMKHISLGSTDIYDRVSVGNGVFHACEFGSGVISKHEVNPTTFARIAATVTSRFRMLIEEPYSSIVVGIVTGNGSRIPKAILEDFTNSGLRHVIVVSGMHMTILGGLCMHTLILCGLYRQHAMWIVLLLLFLFVCVIGMPVSALRGYSMAAIALAVQYAGRQRHAYMVFLLACVCMLVVNPFYLVFSVGFQLSFIATIAIVYAAPFLTELYDRLIKYTSVSQILGVSTAAYLGTIPISAYVFGSVSITSILANVLVVPSIPFIYGLSGITLLAGSYMPLLPNVLEHLLELLLFTVQIIGRIPAVAITFPLWGVLCIYAFAVIGFVFLNRSTPEYE